MCGSSLYVYIFIHLCLFECACFTKRSIAYSHWALTTQPWYSGFNKHPDGLTQTHMHTHSYESNRLARSHHSHTEASVTREKGIQQQALSIQTGNPPQATHTHKDTHTYCCCNGSMSTSMWRTESYKETCRETHLLHTLTHTAETWSEYFVSKSKIRGRGSKTYHLT